MRNKLSLILLLVILFSCSGKKTTYYIHGNFKDSPSSTVYLIVSNNVIDSSAVTADGFSFHGEAGIPQLAYIADARTTRAASQYCMMILEPGLLTVLPLEDSDEYYVSGSKSNELLADLSRKSLELTKYYEEHEEQEGIMEEIESKYNDLLTKGVNENHDLMFGLVCLRELAYEQDPEKTREMLDAFKSDISKSELWKSLDERNVKMLATSTGKPYLEFSQTNADGKLISSKDIMSDPGNKYVLIDFWASWCGPCMREVPYLKETYDKYNSKGFQILGVSLDRNRDAWLKAVSNNQMNWIQVSDLKYWENEVAVQYGINSIPANLLVECSTGKIVATNLRGRNLEYKISELLK